ncbi:reverse transcriptase domain-containing protein [Tanacetum coccineum]
MSDSKHFTVSYTLHGIILTWWNTHVKTVGHDAAYGMPRKTLMEMMTAKYCPRNKIKKLEIEIWNLKVKGTDLASYTQRVQELALMCRRMFLEESDKVEKYVIADPEADLEEDPANYLVDRGDDDDDESFNDDDDDED